MIPIDIIYTYLDLDRVLQQPLYAWDRYHLSRHPYITISFIDTIDRYSNIVGEWDWFSISRFIDINEVTRYPDRTWNRDGLSLNDNINRDILSMNLPNATGEWWDNAIYCRMKK